MKKRNLKKTDQVRSITLKRKAVDVENRSVRFTAASESPVEQFYGVETLLCSAENIDLSRADGMPLLADHDHTKQLGVIESVAPVTRKGRRVLEVSARFSQSATGEEFFKDVQDGIRRNISVGYQISEYEITEGRAGEPDMVTVSRWQLREVSFVALPADPTVGVGRSSKFKTGKSKMPENSVKAERQRVSAILSNAEKFGFEELGREAVAKGTSYADFNAQLVDELGKRNAKLLKAEPHRDGHVDLSRTERSRFNIANLILALHEGPKNPKAYERAAFEFEVSTESERNLPDGVQMQGTAVPWSVISGHRGPIPPRSQRGPILANSGTTGASLIASDHLSAQFIDAQTPMNVLQQTAMITVADLHGDVEIPRQLSRSTPAMAAENADATETGPTFGAVTLSPKRAAAWKSFSGKLLLQSSPDIQDLVMGDFRREIGLLVDRQGLNGSGSSNEAQGVLNVTGINSVDFSTDGKPSFEEVIQTYEAILTDNFQISDLTWLCTPAGWTHFKKTPRQSGGAEGNFILQNGRVADEAMLIVTNQLPAGSHLLGDFSQLIMGSWGSLDVIVDPYTQARKHNIEVTANAYIDFAVRQPAAFAKGA